MSTLLVGPAVTRAGSVGTLYRSCGGGVFEPAIGIPTNTGVQAITADTHRPGRIYASTHAGLYRSDDNGANFTRLSLPSEPGEHFWSVAIHPHDPSILLAGTGPIGVFKSEDGGEQWRRIASPAGMAEQCDMSTGKFFKHSRVMSLAFDPTDPSRVYGAVETSGVLYSGDGGESWENRSAGLIKLTEIEPALRSQINVPDDREGVLDGHAVGLTTARPGVVYYACRMGLFCSEDHGITWTSLNIGQYAPYSYSRDLRFVPHAPTSLYLALSIASRSDAGALYRSDDLGQSWLRADTPVQATSTIMAMGVHPTDGRGACYVARHGQVHWTENSGETWHANQLPSDAGDAYCVLMI